MRVAHEMHASIITSPTYLQLFAYFRPNWTRERVAPDERHKVPERLKTHLALHRSMGALRPWGTGLLPA